MRESRDPIAMIGGEGRGGSVRRHSSLIHFVLISKRIPGSARRISFTPHTFITRVVGASARRKEKRFSNFRFSGINFCSPYPWISVRNNRAIAYEYD